MKVKICADSTCDLSPELVERYGIEITPLHIIKNGVSYTDGLDITPSDIYEHVKAGGDICSTAAVSVHDYITFFKKQLESCDAIVHLHISSDMSSCYQNACIAAEEVGSVYPVDSRNLSTGIGHLVIEGALMAQSGDMTAEQIQAKLIEMRDRLDVSFVVERLDFLAKGGRCSSVALLGANVLSLRPCIEVKDGKMGVGKKYKGNYIKCLQKYVKERLEGRTDIDTRRIFITDSNGFTDEERELIRQEILKYQPFEEILLTRAGCTVSSHCGPRTLGILYFHTES